MDAGPRGLPGVVGGQMKGAPRIYRNPKARNNAVAQLARQGYNYFMGYRDTNGHGLSYGYAGWAWPTGYYKDVARPHPKVVLARAFMEQVRKGNSGAAVSSREED